MAMPRAAYHPLRRWLIISFVPALILSSANVGMGNIFPIVALPVVAVSAFVSAVCILRHDISAKQPGSVKLGKRSRCCSTSVQSFFLVVYDTFWATGIMVVLGFSWDSLGQGYMDGSVEVALTCYSTIPFILDFVIHAYLGLMTLSDMTGGTRLYRLLYDRTVTCPNCQSCLHCSEGDPLPAIGHFRDSHRGYTAVTAKSVHTLYDENAVSEAGDVDESTGLMAPGRDEEVQKSDDGNIV